MPTPENAPYPQEPQINQLEEKQQEQYERELLETRIAEENQKTREDDSLEQWPDIEQTTTNGAVAMAAQKGTARALQICESVLLPTFGFSLLYINIHFIGAYVMHHPWFCKFGEEWMPVKIEGAQSAGKGLEYCEIILFFLANIIWLSLILLIFINISIIIIALVQVAQGIKAIITLGGVIGK